MAFLYKCISAETYAEWLTPAEVMRIVPNGWGFATASSAIARRLQFGSIRAAAKEFMRPNRDPIPFMEIPKHEWKDWACHADLDFWKVGDTVFWKFDSTGYGGHSGEGHALKVWLEPSGILDLVGDYVPNPRMAQTDHVALEASRAQRLSHAQLAAPIQNTTETVSNTSIGVWYTNLSPTQQALGYRDLWPLAEADFLCALGSTGDLDKSPVLVHGLFQMSSAASPPIDTPHTDWARPLYERQIAVLGEMAEAGLRIALEIERRVKAAEPPPERVPNTVPSALKDAVLTFARVSRAVRLSVMLQARLIKALEERDRHGAYLASCAVDRKKAHITRLVERVALGQDLDEDHVDRLVEETAERLDRDDLYGDILSRPVGELIAMICNDLGLALDGAEPRGDPWMTVEGTTGILRGLREGGGADRPPPS